MSVLNASQIKRETRFTENFSNLAEYLYFQSKGKVMFNFEEEKSDEITDWKKNQHLVLDGTAHLEYPENEEIPRVKGLIELFNQFYRDDSGRQL